MSWDWVCKYKSSFRTIDMGFRKRLKRHREVKIPIMDSGSVVPESGPGEIYYRKIDQTDKSEHGGILDNRCVVGFSKKFCL